MKIIELRDGVNIHTKINKKVKQEIEHMNRVTGIDQNVIINSILTKGLADRVPKAVVAKAVNNARRARRQTSARR